MSLKSMSVEKIYICSWNAHKFLCLESDFFVVITEKIGVGSCFLMVGWFGIEVIRLKPRPPALWSLVTL